MTDSELISRFKRDPESAYANLLDRYSTVILRMIRRFMYDDDEVMEVYTSVCERLRARDFHALRRFRINKELAPWLSVVVANACRDRFRKKRAVSVPQSVLEKLNNLEKLVFKYYFQDQLRHDEIAATVTGKNGLDCSTYDVTLAIDKINSLLSVSKRWHLLNAIHQNMSMLSVEDLRNMGFEVAVYDRQGPMAEDSKEERLQRLDDALGKLDPEDQLLVLLRFEHSLKASQIADAMGYDNHKYVYTRLRTVTNRLRRMVGEA
jgi:DNA-directed RNA polymerase specialized sigma24 family protein